MTAKGQLKIFDRKIKQNKADYDLHRKNAEISALSSGELDNYEYLFGKDLEYKPNPLQKAKFEYSSLGQVFNKGLDKEEKLEGLLKRNRKSIGINNEVLMELEKEIKDKENEIRRKKVAKTKMIKIKLFLIIQQVMVQKLILLKT